ncbi:hypothetical protein Ancab_026633 [Ancistrocladus abbreviatus]
MGLDVVNQGNLLRTPKTPCAEVYESESRLESLLMDFKGDDKGYQMPSPNAPKAPRHGPRPPSCLKFTEMRHITAVPFQESSFPSRCMVRYILTKPLCKNRALVYEDELCQAVAQNKLH